MEFQHRLHKALPLEQCTENLSVDTGKHAFIESGRFPRSLGLQSETVTGALHWLQLKLYSQKLASGIDLQCQLRSWTSCLATLMPAFCEHRAATGQETHGYLASNR